MKTLQFHFKKWLFVRTRSIKDKKTWKAKGPSGKVSSTGTKATGALGSFFNLHTRCSSYTSVSHSVGGTTRKCISIAAEKKGYNSKKRVRYGYNTGSSSQKVCLLYNCISRKVVLIELINDCALLSQHTLFSGVWTFFFSWIKMHFFNWIENWLLNTYHNKSSFKK